MGLIVYGGDSPTVKLQEVKIRKDNDFRLIFIVERNGNPEDMEKATIVSLDLITPSAILPLTPVSIEKNIIYLDMDKSINQVLGKYRMELKYTIPDIQFTGGVRDCAIDVYAYTIVANSSEATKIDELAKSIDVATGFQGKAFTWDMYTEEQIEFLQSPALEAAQAALSATQSADSAATAAIQAKNAANTAAQGANTATGHANAAATNANTEAGKATEAAASANSAASDAYQKAIVARQEAEKAQIAASAANKARVSLAQSFQVELEYAEQKLLEVDQAKATALGAANTANEAAAEATTKGNLAETKAGLANNAADNADQARALLVEASDVKMGQVDEKIQEANTAISNANAKAAEANNAAGAANDAAALANTKAGLANDAAGSANEAATTANTAAGLADAARLAIEGDLALKADQTELDQLAGDVKETTEEPAALSLSDLNERIKALESILSRSEYSRMQTGIIDVIEAIRVNGSPLFIFATTAPNVAPDQLPQFWIDTASKKLYTARGTATAGDWF